MPDPRALPRRPARGLHTTWNGEPLHDCLRRQMRKTRDRDGAAPGFCFLPGTHFTNGEHLYEVVYGCQGLGDRPAGWVAALRTDYVDPGNGGYVNEAAPERYCYSLFSWPGLRHPDLRLVMAAPRLDLVA